VRKCRCAFHSRRYWVLSEGIGGGPDVVLAKPAGGAWATDPYPALEVGVVSLPEVLWETTFVVLFAVVRGEDAEELEGGALCYVAIL
jgi:hypothetical protein